MEKIKKLEAQIKAMHDNGLGESWIEAHENSKLKSRVDDLETVNKQWKSALEGLTPGGSEFVNDPEFCAQWVRNSRRSEVDTIKRMKRQRDELEAAARDVLDAFFDMSPLEYAQSRGLPCMNDKVGEDVVDRLRNVLNNNRHPDVVAEGDT